MFYNLPSNLPTDNFVKFMLFLQVLVLGSYIYFEFQRSDKEVAYLNERVRIEKENADFKILSSKASLLTLLIENNTIESRIRVVTDFENHNYTSSKDTANKQMGLTALVFRIKYIDTTKDLLKMSLSKVLDSMDKSNPRNWDREFKIKRTTYWWEKFIVPLLLLGIIIFLELWRRDHNLSKSYEALQKKLLEIQIKKAEKELAPDSQNA